MFGMRVEVFDNKRCWSFCLGVDVDMGSNSGWWGCFIVGELYGIYIVYMWFERKIWISRQKVEEVCESYASSNNLPPSHNPAENKTSNPPLTP